MRDDPWAWLLIEENQLPVNLKSLRIWVKIVRRRVKWESDQVADTFSAIIAGYSDLGTCKCTVCRCNCRVCWQAVRWSEVALTPEEVICQPMFWLEINEDEEIVNSMGLGERPIVKEGKTFHDIMQKLA